MSAPGGARKSYILPLVVLLTVIAAFLSWYSSWFGRELAEEQIERYLTDPDADPQDTQHALANLQRRFSEERPGTRRFLPLVLDLADHPEPALRSQVAWVLGHVEDETAHDVLLELADDPVLQVRRNAACALSKWRDPRARPVLRAMLEPLEYRAPVAGVVDLKVEEEDPVTTGRDIGQISMDDGGVAALRVPAPGRVLEVAAEPESRVAEGQLLLKLAPSPKTAFAALKGLYLVGRAEDIPLVEPYAAGRVPDMSAEVHRQARITVDRLRRR